MSQDRKRIGLDFGRILETISTQIYDTPMAFLRENVQNAVDATRMLAASGGTPGEIEITISGFVVTIHDHGIGMSREDLETFFWSMGSSGKNNELGRRAGCVGTFGIGAFANFGVCDKLEVTSKRQGFPGTRSSLAEPPSDSKDVPEVIYEPSEQAAPHGTIVHASLKSVAQPKALLDYLRPFVRYAAEPIVFNGTKLSQEEFVPPFQELIAVSSGSERLLIPGVDGATIRFYRDRGWTLVASLNDAGNKCRGVIRLERGNFETYKRGFKICSFNPPSHLGFAGRIESDLLQPTAGRDSLSAPAQQWLTRVCGAIEAAAIPWILTSSELLNENARILGYVIQHSLVHRLTELQVSLADGTTKKLGEIEKYAQSGGAVYFGRHANRELLEILQASGNLIVLLSAEGTRQNAERSFLQNYCGAKTFEGLVSIKEVYSQLSTFEQAFLGDLEGVIKYKYDIYDFEVRPASLTGGIPVFSQSGPDGKLVLYVDVRHGEIKKLEKIGLTPLLYSMASEFCKEFLGGVLKTKSAKFFGSGALNFDDLLKRSAELWKLVAEDVAIEDRGQSERATPSPFIGGRGITQHVSVGDIVRIEVVGQTTTITAEAAGGELAKREPKILRIIDDSKSLNVDGYYFRLMDGPAKAFGNDIQAMDEATLFWFGNRITYVFSDGVRTAFHYEVRVFDLISVPGRDEGGGCEALDRPLQSYGTGLFLPIPSFLERYLIPGPQKEVLVKVNYDWFDLKGGLALSQAIHP